MRGFLVGAALAFVPALATTVSADATVWDFAQDLTTNGAQTGNGAGNAWWYFYADPGDRDGAYTLFTQPLTFGGVGYSNPGNNFHLVVGTGSHANPGDGLLHPGTFNFSAPATNPAPDVIVGWRAPTAGTFSVSGRFQDYDGADFDGPADGRGVRAEISSTTTPGLAGSDVDLAAFAYAYLDASNTNEAMRTLLGGPLTLPSVAAFDFTITVAADQWLFFRVNDLGSNRFDSTILNVVIADAVSVPMPASIGIFGLGLAGLAVAARRRRA
jgi:hypothetical protein